MKILALCFSVLFLGLSNALLAQKPDLQFKHISTEKGLSHNNVKSIVKDHMGFMWFGSTFGLNRYDGTNIKIYLNIPNDSTSLSDNDISQVYVDKKNDLWIATRTGLNRYDRNNDKFKRHDELGGSIVNTLFESKSGELWASAGNMLFKMNFQKKQFESFLEVEAEITTLFEDSNGTLWLGADNLFTVDKRKKEPIKHPLLTNKVVSALFEDANKTLWVLSYGNGVYTLSLDSGNTKEFTADQINSNGLATNSVTCINNDKEGNIWIGSLHGGLMIFDVKKELFYNYVSTPGDPESLGFNSIKCIYKDDGGFMWIGTYSSGVDFVVERKFGHIYVNPLHKNGLNNNSIIALAEDKVGNLLIGTDGGGLNVYNKESGKFTYILHDPKNANSIGSNIVSALHVDKRGQLWVGCWDGGLSLVDLKNNRVKRFMHNPLKPNESILNNSILSIYSDHEDNLWIGSLTGLNKMNLESYEVTRYDVVEKDLKNYINAMIEDDEGNFWVGTWDGLTILDKDTKEYTRFLPDEKKPYSLSNDKIFDLFIDSKKRLWIGTAGGLNLYNYSDKSFKSFRARDGLPSDAVYGILQDEQGHLWLSTANGLCRFDPESQSFINYNSSDGLQGNQFKEHAFVRMRSGDLVFGGVNGINIFRSENLDRNAFVPPVVLVDFRIFNSTMPIGGENSPLDKHISLTEVIKLTHKESVFSFEFAALNYLVPEKNQYAYKLEGFEEDWNYVKTQKNATYTNLDPGKYTLRVKASNNDLVWNEEGASLNIIIEPPFYRTWWFVLLSALILLVSLYLFIKSKLKGIKEYQRKLKQQVKERTSEISHKNLALEDQAIHLIKANTEIKEKEQKLEYLYSEIKDSIRAAEVIQKSILPPEETIKECFSDVFLLYKPKDVVSGDFYWFDVIGDHKVIAAVDCTGHGVSGAFMSINGHHLLNKAIYDHKNLNPAEILDRLNCAIVKEFNKTNKENKFKDGMDVSLCVFNKDNSKLQFSGAGLSIYILRGKELIQIAGNRLSIGLSFKNNLTPYINNEVDLQKGDTVYLFSDGFPDQMGGINGDEKFSYPQFRNHLVSFANTALACQGKRLENALHQWMADVEQLDDIMVIGLKV